VSSPRVAQDRRDGTAAGALPGEQELLERDCELAALEETIGGRGSPLLVIEGPPGIGKTALLGQARRRGRAAGLRVLGARGSELEQSFSYGVVRQLFEPLLASVDAGERAALLGGAAPVGRLAFQKDDKHSPAASLQHVRVHLSRADA